MPTQFMKSRASALLLLPLLISWCWQPVQTGLYVCVCVFYPTQNLLDAWISSPIFLRLLSVAWGDACENRLLDENPRGSELFVGGDPGTLSRREREVRVSDHDRPRAEGTTRAAASSGFIISCSIHRDGGQRRLKPASTRTLNLELRDHPCPCTWIPMCGVLHSSCVFRSLCWGKFGDQGWVQYRQPRGWKILGRSALPCVSLPSVRPEKSLTR